MTNANRIKKQYCRPAIYINELEWHKYGRGTLPNHFHVELFIWVDQALPEYRVAIPEDTTQWGADEIMYRQAWGGGIQTRFLTYLPTGRAVYDNTLPEINAVAFEYRLQQWNKDMVPNDQRRK